MWAAHRVRIANPRDPPAFTPVILLAGVLLIIFFMFKFLAVLGTEHDLFFAAHYRSQREPTVKHKGNSNSETAQSENETRPTVFFLWLNEHIIEHPANNRHACNEAHKTTQRQEQAKQTIADTTDLRLAN